MKIQEETVQHIAHLARLQFQGEEVKAIQQDLNNMIAFMDKLSELDTANVEPLVFMSEEINVLREDISEDTLSVQEALKNAPKKDSDYFRIPKVLDKKA
jgi:aspartyl-tRNA(Asn)/glutamyl-tRNA(Gln) amidotransferase subunit C